MVDIKSHRLLLTCCGLFAELCSHTTFINWVFFSIVSEKKNRLRLFKEYQGASIWKE